MAKRKKRRLKKQVKMFLFIIIFVLILIIVKNINKEQLETNRLKITSTTTTTKKIIKEEVSLDAKVFYQYPDYPTGCEISALYMLLSYYDIDVTMEELNDNLDKGPSLYFEGEEQYAANPNKEFVGDPTSEFSYGVFNEPIRKLASIFKKGAKSSNNTKIEKIKEILSSGNPIVAWYSITPDSEIKYNQSWLDYETGEKITWPTNEHAILITGYDNNNITYNDSNIGKARTIPIDQFLINFDILGGMIVYYE